MNLPPFTVYLASLAFSLSFSNYNVKARNTGFIKNLSVLFGDHRFYCSHYFLFFHLNERLFLLLPFWANLLWVIHAPKLLSSRWDVTVITPMTLSNLHLKRLLSAPWFSPALPAVNVLDDDKHYSVMIKVWQVSFRELNISYMFKQCYS